MEKLRNLLNKNVKEFNLKIVIGLCLAFLFACGLLSYKLTMNSSYALFSDSVAGTKKINVHYQDAGQTFSEGVLAVLKDKAEEIENGVYYFDESGYLDYGDENPINLELNSKIPKGVVSIWNKTPIYACLAYDDDYYEYDLLTNKISTREMPCIIDRSQNLVINGDLSSHDNTNFESFGTYNQDGYIANTTKTTAITTDFIPVDVAKKYQVSVDLKSSNTDATYYAGYVTYDEKKNEITFPMTRYVNNSMTELAEALNPGDKTIKFKDLSGWDNNTGVNKENRGFIFWNYEDSTGYKYPELTFSKNTYFDGTTALYEDSAVDKTNNTITLTSDSGWAGPLIEKDTKVSQISYTGGYQYNVLSSSVLSTNWTPYTGNIIGSFENGVFTANKFRPGTKYIKFVILTNFNNTPDTTTQIKNISIKEITE